MYYVAIKTYRCRFDSIYKMPQREKKKGKISRNLKYGKLWDLTLYCIVFDVDQCLNIPIQ